MGPCEALYRVQKKQHCVTSETQSLLGSLCTHVLGTQSCYMLCTAQATWIGPCGEPAELSWKPELWEWAALEKWMLQFWLGLLGLLGHRAEMNLPCQALPKVQIGR